MSALAEHMVVAVSSLTSLMDRLVEKKLVKRERSEKDRRIVLVRLTGAGREVMEAGNAVFLDSVRGLLDYLGVKDSNELHRLLLKAMDFIKIKEGLEK